MMKTKLLRVGIVGVFVLIGCPTEEDSDAAVVDAAVTLDAAVGMDAPGLDAPGLDAPLASPDAFDSDAPGLDALSADTAVDAFAPSSDGSVTDAAPVSDPRILTLRVGRYGACVIDRSHRLWCWGRDDFPSQVSDWTDVTDVDVAQDGTCAVRADGLWCWGTNPALGPSATPTRITLPLPLPIRSVAVGGTHVCVAAADGVHCWGTGLAALDSNGMEPIDTLPDTVQLAASGSTGCARDSAGAVRCWGGNVDGSLGDGSTLDRRRPVVAGLTGAIDLQLGPNSSCAATVSGGSCWGSNVSAMLGDGTTMARAWPTPVLGGPYVEISQGWVHGVGLRADGSVWEWGVPRGASVPAPVLAPVLVLGLPPALHLEASDDGNCALAVDGEVYCWGYGTLGRPGAGSRTPRRVTFPCEPACPSPMECWDGACVPPPPPPPTGDAGVAGARVVSLGQRCAVHATGLVTCWGSGYFGDGAGEMSSSTPRIVPVGGAIEVTASGSSACVLVDDGQVYCWGDFVGDGTPTRRLSPTRTVGLPPIAHLRGNNIARAAIGMDGSVWMWGSIDSDMSVSTVHTPRRVAGATNVVDGVFGHRGFCTLDTSGVLRCWPRGAEGSVETIATDPSITRLTGSSSGYACALGTELRCWGGVPGFGTLSGDTPIAGFTGARAVCAGGESLVIVDSAGDTYLSSRLVTGLPEADDCGEGRCIITTTGPIHCNTLGTSWSIRRTL